MARLTFAQSVSGVIMDFNNFDSAVKAVADALKLCREGRTLELATLPLAHSALVETCFLTGVPISTDVRGQTTRSVLRWAIDRLRPGGSHSWMANDWRAHNILQQFYFAGTKVAELAELLAIAEQTLYKARGEALVALARLLQRELEHPSDLVGRRNYAIADRYELHAAQEQLVLRLLASFEQAMPLPLLHTLAAANGVTDVQNIIHTLRTANWIVMDDGGNQLLVHPELQLFLQTRLSPEEKREWHVAIGRNYLDRRAYFEAAHHLMEGGAFTDSAEIIIANYQTIVNNLQMEELVQLIDQMHPSDIDPLLYARLKIVAGDAARLMSDVDTALANYRDALSAEDTDVKALAYYRRARALVSRNLDEALAHYGYCIQLLAAQSPPSPLLAEVYLDRSAVYLQERPDAQLAQADLEQAQQLIQPDQRNMMADLHTGWLTISLQQTNWQGAIDHGLQAWLAANETKDVNRMIRTAHNLGMSYVRAGRYEQALSYLEKARDLAVESGNRHMVGLNEKTLGGSWFMLADYTKARDYYLRARQIFEEMGNENWLAHTYYDLAEVYGALNQSAQLQQHYLIGIQIAQKLRDEQLLAEFEALRERFGAVQSSLNERQLKALDWVQAHGSITNRQFQTLNEVSARQALRDLGEMEEARVLIKVGKGRSTRYEIVG